MTATGNQMSLIKQAYLKIEELERRLAEQDKNINEPIAVVGIGCRFPGGADDPNSFWKLLTDGRDAVGPFPADRFELGNLREPGPDGKGRIYVDCGGFLDEDISRFDAQFFGISQREANALDPQQRILLEIAWEALEHAGQNPDDLVGSKTGVFLGLASSDYRQVVVREGNLANFNLYFITGNAFSTASGRVSYLMGLNGPSLTVDTACSASLTALHYACQSLRTGESNTALAGGMNLVLSPEDLLAYCNATMLSPTGRCRSFDRTADGFILSEGGGVVVLKRLSDAVKDDNTIYAVIRGSAVNQDGASNGMTAPNSLAQEKLIRETLATAKLSASDIGFIEAHGSGTPLGDPIEFQALSSVFGERSHNPLVVGCVKSNIGHCAAAAGIAGLIKSVLSVYHKKIPANLHFKDPNPLIPWDKISVKVPTVNVDWSPKNGICRAGVSSFGVSGTNAHVVLEEPPRQASRRDSQEWQLLPLSAKTEAALGSMLSRLNSWLLRNPDALLADIAYTLQTGRKVFPYRRFIVGNKMTDITELLSTNSKQSKQSYIFNGKIPKVVFVFPGQGTQYPGMGAELYAVEPVFRSTFDECAEAFSGILEEDLRKIVFPQDEDNGAEKLKNTLYAQPAIFSIEYSLAKLWQSRGIQPDALVGHSIGEFVAACLAKTFTLEDAVRVVAIRSKLMNSLLPGGMVSVRASEEIALKMLLPELSIAAVNSPKLCVVSGPFDKLKVFEARCEKARVPFKALNTSHAFHSSMVEPVLMTFKKEFDTIVPSKPSVPIMSTATGAWMRDIEAVDPMYWTRHMRVSVRFSDAIKQLMKEWKNIIFLETGPRGTSTTLIRQHFTESSTHAALSSMNDVEESEAKQLLTTTGELWLRGIAPDWRKLSFKEQRLKISMPTYPFERQQYWISREKKYEGPSYYYSESEQNDVQMQSNSTSERTRPEFSNSSREDGPTKRIRAMIAEALGCSADAIDESTPFLNLGMDSLLMRQFSFQIQKEFKVSVKVRELMRDYSTIQTLSAFIESPTEA